MIIEIVDFFFLFKSPYVHHRIVVVVVGFFSFIYKFSCYFSFKEDFKRKKYIILKKNLMVNDSF